LTETISIIICTYDRQELLELAIQSIAKATYSSSIIELIIVNNGEQHISKPKNQDFPYELRVIKEERQGLSNARNTGARKAKGNWLLYLDDDGKIEPQTLVETANTIMNHDFQMFTGIYKAWHYYETPKWFPDEWASYQMKGPNIIRDLGPDYISGGIMAIKKSILTELGYFPTNLGMKGDATKYGEESYLESKLREQNRSLGINPNMVLEHIVGTHKMKLSWILKASFARGRDGVYVHHKRLKDLPLTLINLLIRIVKNVFRSTWYLFTKKDYYIQNSFLDNAGPFFGYLGEVYSILKKAFTKVQQP